MSVSQVHPFSFVKTLFLVSVLVTLLPELRAQPIRNDPDPTRWITYAQTYVKIPIVQTGLYRITTVELRQAGIPTHQIDPTTVQVFHRGVEQAIYVDGETDRQLDEPDYIEFYGRANDGAQDSLLYRPTHAQPHPYYSLFSDTTAYFLTWRLDGQPGRRMVAYTDTAYADLTPEDFHWEEELRLFTDNYPGWAAGIPPWLETSYYDAGEGYTGPKQTKNKPYTTLFSLQNPVREGPAPQLDVLFVGRDFTSHRVACLVGPTAITQRLADSLRFTFYNNARLQIKAVWSDISPDGTLLLSTLSRGEAGATNAYSVSYIRLRYPQRLLVNGQSTRLFQLARNPAGRSLIDLPDVLPNTRFWDVSDPTAPQRIGIASRSMNSVRLVVRETNTARTLLSVSQPRSVPAIRPVTFTNWTSRKPTYLIVTHETLMHPVDASTVDASTPGAPTAGDTASGGRVNAVREYARYRASAAGGGHDTLVVTMQQLIDQYSYGERHPLAIRRFADQLLRQSGSALQSLLLIGRSRSTPGIRHDPNQASLDLVMTAGFPGSDAVFTAGLNGEPSDLPALPTGRINAGSPQEVMQYLAKVKEYERQTDLLWRKQLLHLSGGTPPTERSQFRQITDTYRQQIDSSALGAQVTTYAKATDQPTETTNLQKPVNEGVGLITFFGHSGLDVTDLDIGFCSNDALGYRNQGKYPLLLINGCAIGNFYYGRSTLATDWVLTPDRGAIAAIAQSHLGYPDVMHQYSSTFYSLLADSTQLTKSIGQLQQEIVRRLLTQGIDGRALANCQQMVLQGDPAIRLFPVKTPDYSLTAGGLRIQDTYQQPLMAGSDSVLIRAIVQNAGQYRNRPLPVRIRRFMNGREPVVYNQLLPRSVAYCDTLTLVLPNEQGAEGDNQFEVTINPADSPLAHIETNHTNNQTTIRLTLAGQKPVLVYPAPGSVIYTPTVRLTAYYAASIPHQFMLELDTTVQFDSPVRVRQQVTTTNIISYGPIRLTHPGKTHYWRVRLSAISVPLTPVDSLWETGSFTYAPDRPATGLPEGQIRLSAPLPTAVQQGEVVPVQIEFVNLSPYPFADSLLVQQTVYATGLFQPQQTQWRLKAPGGSDTIRFTTLIATAQLPSLSRIRLTVNPHRQPEYSFLNNTLDLSLAVQPGVLGPLLDVAFDGVRISNGSVVSAQPVIDVLVTDKNRSFIRRDTTDLDLFLQSPGSDAQFRRLSWRNAIILPTGEDNKLRIQYVSPKLPEGEHHLVATARNAVGNRAVPYQVSFQVVNQRSLTSLTVYPNPFCDQTRFAFTLTGDQPPAQVSIALTDLQGRILRHLNQPARIGLNEWTWNGRSDAGAPLPAGVYLYSLTLTDPSGWSIDPRINGKLSGRILLAPSCN